MLLALLSLVAHATTLSPAYAVGETHTWQTEAWYARPLYLESTTWRTVAAQGWGAVLRCTTVAPRVESCRFVDGMVVWAYQETPTSAPVRFELPISATLEITWTKTGRVTATDVRGDRTGFWDAAIAAQGRLHRSGNGVVRSENDRRAWGQVLERELVRSLLGGLDLELPPGGKIDDGWIVRNLPTAAKRFDATSGAVTLKAQRLPGEDLDATLLAWEGTGSAAPTNWSAPPEELEVRARGAFDAHGRVLASEVVVGVTNAVNLRDHGVTVYKVVALEADDASATEPLGPPPVL